MLSVSNKKYAVVKNKNLNNKDIIITENGNYYTEEGYSGFGLVRVQVPEPVYQEIEVNPSIVLQEIEPDIGYNGITKVTVNPVTSAIDSNIKSENIVKGVTILGVEGNVEFITDDLNINPSTSAQSFTPAHDGFYNINVGAVTSDIDSNIKAKNIKSGVSILGVNGNLIPSNETTRNIVENGTYTPPSPYTGFSEVVVDVAVVHEELNITPSRSAQTFTAIDDFHGFSPVKVAAVQNVEASNIKQGVTILDVTGSVIELHGQHKDILSNGDFVPDTGYNAFTSIHVDVDTINNTDLTATPTTSLQVFTPPAPYTGYNQVKINGVTSAIDANIKAENIKKNVTILGVTGNYEEPLQSKTLTINQNSNTTIDVTPDTGYTGLSSVRVDLSWIETELQALNAGDIDTSTLNLQDKTITAAGTYTCDAGYDGLGTVTIDLDWVDQALIDAASGNCTGEADDIINGNVVNIATDANRVRAYSFYNCTQLNKAVLNNATSIEDYAFYNTNLTSLTIKSNSLCTLGNNVFSTNPTIYVPSSLVNTYRNNAKWSSYTIQSI